MYELPSTLRTTSDIDNAGVLLQLSTPPAPQTYTKPLPPEDSTTSMTTVYLEDYLFPISILSHLSPEQRKKLRAIPLTSPIHIHAPIAHIGTFYGDFSGQKINALDLFICLQSISEKPVSFLSTYSGLSQVMKSEVEMAFIRRNGESSNAVTSWERFVSGQDPDHGPVGYDLLLGNGVIWGIEVFSHGGSYSVVHVA